MTGTAGLFALHDRHSRFVRVARWGQNRRVIRAL
jgi:hypothetical protein